MEEKLRLMENNKAIISSCRVRILVCKNMIKIRIRIKTHKNKTLIMPLNILRKIIIRYIWRYENFVLFFTKTSV